MTDSIKQYQCEVCDKAFPSPSALKEHEVVHTGERPFVCDVCGITFRFRSNLRRHRIKNTCQISKSSRNKPRNLGRNVRKSVKAVLNEIRTVSTPNTERKRSNEAPTRSRSEAEKDLEAMSDDSDRSEQQREIDSDSVISTNRETGNNGNNDEVIYLYESNQDKTEEKPGLMFAPIIKSTPSPIEIEQDIPIVQEVGDLMPLLDLSTSSFPPLASQQRILEMDMDS